MRDTSPNRQRGKIAARLSLALRASVQHGPVPEEFWILPRRLSDPASMFTSQAWRPRCLSEPPPRIDAGRLRRRNHGLLGIRLLGSGTRCRRDRVRREQRAKGAGGPGKIGRTGFDGGEAVGFRAPRIHALTPCPSPSGERGASCPHPLPLSQWKRGASCPHPLPLSPRERGASCPPLGPFRAPTEGWSGEGSLE